MKLLFVSFACLVSAALAGTSRAMTIELK